MLTGQINPTKGSASVAGCDVVKEHARLKSRIGIVFDEPNLYERLTVRLNLEFCCWLYIVANDTPLNLKLSHGERKLVVTLALLTSISVGISLVSTLLVEEKEKRTLRLLLVSPASITDVVLAKLLVGVVYQFVLSLVVLAVLHGFVGNLPLVLLFVLLSSLFGLALSLLAGSIFHTTSGLGGFLGIVSLLFIIPFSDRRHPLALSTDEDHSGCLRRAAGQCLPPTVVS